MVNVTAAYILSRTKSFIINNEGGYLEIHNSTFTNLVNFERGAVITGGYQNSRTLIYNSTFVNNTSMYGGVANVYSGSSIEFYDCKLNNNFAIQSGVIQTNENGYFQFYRSDISQNYAYSVSVSEVYLSSIQSKISNTTISMNAALSLEEILTQINDCTYLCFLHDLYKDFLLKNLNFLTSTQSKYAIQCILSSLTIDDASEFISQESIIDAYLSNLEISESLIHNVSSNRPLIVATSSNVKLKGAVVRNIQTSGMGLLLSATIGTQLDIEDLMYSLSSMMLIRCSSSQMRLRASFSGITLVSSLLEISDCYDSVIEDTSISRIATTSSNLIQASSSTFTLIRNLTIEDVNAIALDFHNCIIESISMVQITRSLKGMHLFKSKLPSLQDINVSNCGSENLLHGGAIYSEDSNITITNSSFSNNTAIDGGAIVIFITH